MEDFHMQEMSGYMYSKGKYVAFFDSDDYIEKNMYKEMMDKTLEYEYDIITSDLYMEYEETRKKNICKFKYI